MLATTKPMPTPVNIADRFDKLADNHFPALEVG